MLQNTFIHIQGIGTITEQRLWDSGLRDWDAFSDDISIPLSGSRKYLLKEGIGESKRHLKNNNPSYFSKVLIFRFLSNISISNSAMPILICATYFIVSDSKAV
jgi:hypothetical protein